MKSFKEAVKDERMKRAEAKCQELNKLMEKMQFEQDRAERCKARFIKRMKKLMGCELPENIAVDVEFESWKHCAFCIKSNLGHMIAVSYAPYNGQRTPNGKELFLDVYGRVDEFSDYARWKVKLDSDGKVRLFGYFNLLDAMCHLVGEPL